jgi:hypothetical protein
MPLFFFDIHDGSELARDDSGVECSSLAEFSDKAIDVLPDIAREQLPNGPRRTFLVKVRDDAGRYVFRASSRSTQHGLSKMWAVSTNPREPLGRCALSHQSPS